MDELEPWVRAVRRRIYPDGPLELWDAARGWVPTTREAVRGFLSAGLVVWMNPGATFNG